MSDLFARTLTAEVHNDPGEGFTLIGYVCDHSALDAAALRTAAADRTVANAPPAKPGKTRMIKRMKSVEDKIDNEADAKPHPQFAIRNPLAVAIS